jgi:ferredoxin-type protein NapH
MFGVPLADPLAVLQLSIKNLYPPTLDNFIGAFLPLLLAFFLGTVFCSWICPFGLLAELVQKARRKILGKKYQGLPVFKKGFSLKMIIFSLGLLAFFVFSTTPVLNQLSMPAWYTRFFQYYFGQDVISLCFLFIFAVLLIEFFAAKRLWCRYICPQSVLITLAKQLNKKRLRVVFDKEKCICKPGYARCEMACTLSLSPKTLLENRELECSNCGDCIVACKKMGQALFFASPYRLSKRKITAHLQGIDKQVFVVVLAVCIVIGGILALASWITDTDYDSSPAQPTKSVSRLLDNKVLSWQGAQANYYELLADGTLICVGGDWPINGFKGGRWQQVDEKGTFRMIFDPSQPENFTLVTPKQRLGNRTALTIQQYKSNTPVAKSGRQRPILTYKSLQQSHLQAATFYNATALLSRYAEEVYVLDLRVQDPKGSIRKILTEGDVITTEVMLTNVKYWLNTPQIIVSEGSKPALPIKSKMEILFFDDHKEIAEFVTAKIVDRSDEVFDDPWF